MSFKLFLMSVILSNCQIWHVFTVLHHSFAVDELNNAFKLDANSFEAKYSFPKPDTDAVLVTQCQLGGRAGKAAAILREMGYTRVDVYTGSFKDWVAKGGAVKND